MTPATADIRRFLVNTFSDEDLKTLCFDYFRDVYDDFTTGMTKGQMIQLLIERCVRREALARLEAALRAERPDQYVKQFGTPTPPPVSPAIPAETAPAGRNPRQVFISHAHQDAEFAHRLAADLGSAGWRAWIAPESIQPGEKWVEAIGRGLDGSGVFLVVLTPAAIKSRWVRKETFDAIDLEVRGEVRFVPLELESCVLPTMWGSYQRASFRGRYEDGLQALLRRLSGTPDAASAARTSEAVQSTKQSHGRAPVLIRGTPGTPMALPSRAAPAADPIAFDWVTIPAGEFLMGSDKQKDKLASDDEVPQHTVTLPTFRIGRYPVTNGEYAVFVNATGQPAPPHWLGIQPPFDLRDHPVVAIGWHDAVAFCTWLSQKRGTEIRLPSEAEWERAARDTDGRIYPWGNDFDAARCNMADTGVGDTTSVGIFSAGNAVCGAADMAGNVLEWTRSLWGKDSSKPKFGYPYDPKDGRENQSAPDTMLRVLRGGSFFHRVQDVRCAARHSSHPRGIRLSFLGGFRIVSPGS